MTLLAKKNMEQPYACKYCNKKFHRDSTLTKHMCVKKRRYMDINTSGSRFGFRAFQRFYTLTTTAKKLKTVEEFINSPYYIDFAKFGCHLDNLRPIHIEQYIDFVIRNGVALKDWTKDHVYYLYVEDFVRREPAASALERTITEIIKWCEENNTNFTEFFKSISANEAAHLIQTGRISPWVLYLSKSGSDLMNRFNEDHASMIGRIIDPKDWMKKFKKDTDDVDYVESMLEQAGL